MEQMLLYLQLRQEESGIFLGRKEDVLRQLAHLGETDLQFAQQKLIRRARKVIMAEVRATAAGRDAPLCGDPDAAAGTAAGAGADDAHLSFTEAMRTLKTGEAYLRLREKVQQDADAAVARVAEACVQETGQPYLFSPFVTVPQGNGNHTQQMLGDRFAGDGLGSGAQVFSFEDDDTEWCDDVGIGDAVAFHQNLLSLAQRAGGVCLVDDTADPAGGGVREERVPVSPEAERAATLSLMGQMAADCCDNEHWASVRENVVAATFDVSDAVSNAALCTLVQFLKVTDGWQTAQVVGTLSVRLLAALADAEGGGGGAAAAAAAASETDVEADDASTPSPSSGDGLLAGTCGERRRGRSLRVHGRSFLFCLVRLVRKGLESVEGCWMHLDFLPKLVANVVKLFGHRRVIGLLAQVDPLAGWFEALAKPRELRALLFANTELLAACAKTALSDQVDAKAATIASLTAQQRLRMLAPRRAATPDTPEAASASPASARSARSNRAAAAAAAAAMAAAAAEATTAAEEDSGQLPPPPPPPPPPPALPRAGEVAAAAGEEETEEKAALLLQAVHVLGLTLTYAEGRNVFPLALVGADLAGLHMFATCTTVSSLLLADEFLVASTAVHGVILQVLQEVYCRRAIRGGGPTVFGTRLVSIFYTTVRAYVGASGLDSPVDVAMVINSLKILTDYSTLSTPVDRAEIAVPTGDTQALLIASMRLVCDLIELKKGCELLLRWHPEGTLPSPGDGTLMGAALRVVFVCFADRRFFPEAVVLEAARLVRALLVSSHAAVHGIAKSVFSGGALPAGGLSRLLPRLAHGAEEAAAESADGGGATQPAAAGGADTSSSDVGGGSGSVVANGGGSVNASGEQGDGRDALGGSAGLPEEAAAADKEADTRLFLALLDSVAEACSLASVMRVVLPQSPQLVGCLTKRAVVRALTGVRRLPSAGAERLALLTLSSDLLTVLNAVGYTGGLAAARRAWDVEGVPLHQTSLASDQEAKVAKVCWGTLRLSMLCSTTWQTKSSLLKATIASALSPHPDPDVHVAELSILAACSVMMLDSALVLLQKHDVRKKALQAQLADSTVHPASLLRHLVVTAVGVVGGPLERAVPRTHAAGWPYLYFEGPWSPHPTLSASPVGGLCPAHCGLLYDDECVVDDATAAAAAAAAAAAGGGRRCGPRGGRGQPPLPPPPPPPPVPDGFVPEVAEGAVEPEGWTYPAEPSVLVGVPVGEAPAKLASIVASLKAAVEQAGATARSDGMCESRREWHEGVREIYAHALVQCANMQHRAAEAEVAATEQPAPAAPGAADGAAQQQQSLGSGRAVFMRQLHVLVLRFANGVDKAAAAAAAEPIAPSAEQCHVLANTAATMGVAYGVALGLIEGNAAAHVTALRHHLSDIDWVAVVLYIVAGGDALLCVAKHPTVRFFGGDTTNTLRLTAAAEYVLSCECDALLEHLTRSGVPLCFVVHLWTRQAFLNFLDWDDVASTLALTLLNGPEYLVFIIVSCVVHMQEGVRAHAHGEQTLPTFFAVTPIVDAKNRPYRVADYLTTLQGYRARHSAKVVAILS